MKKWGLIIGLGILFNLLSSFKWTWEEQREFNTFFESKTLRIDYELVGDAVSEEFVLKQLKKQEIWAGPQRLVNGYNLDLGNYIFTVYDSITNEPLYKGGFCSLFGEWQTTEEAKTTKESYYHVNLIPFPKNTIKYVLEKRKFSDGKFETITELYINPSNYFILNEPVNPYEYSIVQGGRNSQYKIDIAFIAEGYTQDEMKKFKQDVKKTWDYITSIHPFDLLKDKFNVYAVESPSVESGTDIPGENIYKNTILNSSFYTFNTPRYLTSKDLKSMHDIAAIVPYDYIFVLINSDRYGGGGFYNYYSATTSDHGYSLKVAIHEFGHGFAGLADEYYDSDVAYDDYYNLNVEPWEPNITTLVDFDKKWKDMVPESFEIPTSRNYDYRDSVGVYEGGGYATKGIYSPFQDCRMKSNIPDGFCPVCTEAIKKVIKYYTK
ncbi:MAG: peptidase M64 [Salinivirgaceae bacterium]|nr:peptidase M64 [Salinivirgaceae bacterium]